MELQLKKQATDVEILAFTGLLGGTAGKKISQQHQINKQISATEKKLEEEQMKLESLSKAQIDVITLIREEMAAKAWFDKITPLIEKLKELIFLDKKRGYLGERRGWEVCLTNPPLWPELATLFQPPQQTGN